MHDYPETTKILTESERSYIIDVLKQDSNNLSSRFDTQFIWQAIKDYKTYVQSLIYLRLLVLGYAIALFSPTIINELDYSAVNAQLLSVLPFAAGCIGTIIFGIYSDKHNIHAYERARHTWELVWLEEETAEEKAERERLKAEQLERMRDDPYYIMDN